MTALDTLHSWEFILDGVNRTPYIDHSSVVMTDSEGAEIDTLYFEMADPTGSLDVHSWQSILWGTVEEPKSVLFQGLVISAENTALDGALGRLWRVKCEDYQTLIARTPIYETVYVDHYPGDIVIDLLDHAGLLELAREKGTLTYNAYEFTDDGRDFGEWETSSGPALFALIVISADGTTNYGYCGEASGHDHNTISIYQDIELSVPGWNGQFERGQIPRSYFVRRAYQFSGHPPIDISNVVTGTVVLEPFATNTEESLPAALTRLAQQVGWVWRLSPLLELYFGPTSLDLATFDVSDAENADYVTIFPALAGTVSISRDGREMINQVVIHGGAKESSQQIETFTYSSGSKVFQLAHRNLIDITVYVNYRVVADGTVWWNTFGDYAVLVNYAEGWIWFNTLVAGDTILVRYHYYEELLYTLRDETSIATAMQTLTKHIWDESITNEDRAKEVALAVLDEYGFEIVTGTFEVWRLGLHAGQQIHLTFAAYGIDGDYVIRKLDIRIDESNTGVVCFVQFGGRSQNLSNLINRLPRMPDVWYGNVANLVNVAMSNAQNAITKDTYLAKRDTATVDATEGGVTVTLPPAITLRGRVVRVVKVDGSANPVSVLSELGETINDASSITLSGQWDAVTLFSTGTDWIAWSGTDAGGGGIGEGMGHETLETVDAFIMVENGRVIEIIRKSTAVSSARVTAMSAGSPLGAAMAESVYTGA